MPRGPAPTYDLTFQDVLDILKLIDASPFEHLEVQVGDLHVKVSRRAGSVPAAEPPRDADTPDASGAEREPAPGGPASGEPGAPPAPGPAPAAAGGQAVDPAGMVAVKPPMAGTFYRAPAPGAPAFVEAGDRVKPGDTVGIVEVMKLFTPVTSPCGGAVRRILVGNEAFVQADQTLMLIEPAAE